MYTVEFTDKNEKTVVVETLYEAKMAVLKRKNIRAGATIWQRINKKEMIDVWMISEH